jgi:hypothetical protein
MREVETRGAGAVEEASAFRVAYADHPSGRYRLNQPNQILQHPLVRGHLVVGCLQDDDPEGQLLQVMFKLEALIDRQENVKPALYFGDEHMVLLAGPSQISDGIHRTLW